MIRILKQIFRTGIVTEPVPPITDPEIEKIGVLLESVIRRRFSGSLAIRQVDAGSCNGCELEIHAMNNALYNCERFGIHFTASPRFADMLLVTGPVSHNMEIALRRTFEATPSPRIVVACGDCGCTGGIFGENYASLGRIDRVIPVDVRIPGCPPSPVALLQGILKAIREERGLEPVSTRELRPSFSAEACDPAVSAVREALIQSSGRPGGHRGPGI